MNTWRDDALCRGEDTTVFFTLNVAEEMGLLEEVDPRPASRRQLDRRGGPTAKALVYREVQRRQAAARAICADCSVADPCLADALSIPPADDVDGIRAGTTARERIHLRRQ